MRDSLDDLETDVGRFSEVKIPSGQPAASASSLPPQQLRRALSGKHVCPFCGTQRETDIGSCPNCTLEDSTTTRSATRSKLGPWYVLQSRNPSAPGMNYATLMVLVQKGRVTARSVVRGPTTGQFWRHAARVKGVSREFGLCWSCGGDVAKNARTCPACKRSQEPPADPDILLEASSEVSGDELVEAMWADHAPGTAAAAPPTASRPAPAVDRSSPAVDRQSQVDRLVARGGVRREVAAPSNGAGQPAGAASQQRATLSRAAVTEELPASNLDMAVFHRPRSGGAPSTGGATRKILKTMFVAILILCSGVVVMASFDPGMRDKLIGWAGRGKTWATSTIHTIRFGNNKPVTNDGGDTAGELAHASSGAAASEVSTPEQAKQRVWELWQVGVDAEKKGNFAGAVKAWEQIKGLKVGEDELPLGLDERIAAAKKRIK